MTVNTSKVAGRRELHFNNLEEILSEAERLAAGKVRGLGNWTLGQALGHLAEGMNLAIDGTTHRPPWFIRLLGPWMKRGILRKMPPGFQLPKAMQDRLVPPVTTSTAEGLAALRKAVARMRSETKRAPSNFLGKLTNEECDRLQCSHAEMHLSFFVPDA